MQNALISNEWQRILDYKIFKIEIQKLGENNSDFLQSCLRPEITSTLLNLQKFQGSEKSIFESCRMYWNLRNDKDIGSEKLIKLKYKRVDQIIQTFCKIGFPKILVPPSLICRNFKIMRKVPLDQAECIQI